MTFSMTDYSESALKKWRDKNPEKFKAQIKRYRHSIKGKQMVKKANRKQYLKRIKLDYEKLDSEPEVK